mgnify:FL=1
MTGPAGWARLTDMSDQMNSNQPPANQNFGGQHQNFGANAQQPQQGAPAQQQYGNMNPQQSHYGAQQQPHYGGQQQGQFGAMGANPYAATPGQGESKQLPQQLRSIGMSALGIGVLLAIWNIVNGLSLLPYMSFFEAFFVVESPIHFIQAYGSIICIVVGIGLLVASASIKKK